LIVFPPSLVIPALGDDAAPLHNFHSIRRAAVDYRAGSVRVAPIIVTITAYLHYFKASFQADVAIFILYSVLFS
jgi:hypothetical protein